MYVKQEQQKMKALILLSCLSLVQGYHILCIQSVPSRSHYNLMYGIVKPLLKAGHEITMITGYPETKPIKNLNLINIGHVKKYLASLNALDKNTMGIRLAKLFSRNVSEAVAATVRETLTNSQFDAVVSEWFFSDSDAGYAAVQQVPWILLLGSVMSPHMEYLVDSVRSIPTIPIILNDVDMPMSFWQRIKNTSIFLVMGLIAQIENIRIEWDYNRKFAPIAKARGISLPPFKEAIHNISVVFVNSHPILAPAQSLPPNVINIAGYHMDDDVPKLPEDLQLLLNSSTQGFIYFSMGSVIRTNDLSNETKRDLVRVMGQMPYTVLWKFDGQLSDLPKNLHVRSWMPQSSILAHRNIKLFITHGGLLSIIEALNFGVPILAMPVYGDQPSNADRAVMEGYGLRVDFSEDMGDDLAAAVKEITSNNSYYHRAKSLSALFRDRPVSPSKLIQHYVELAIRSKGAYHLRSKTFLYKWYQLLMLDQLLFCLSLTYCFYIFVKAGYLFVIKKIVGADKVKKH